MLFLQYLYIPTLVELEDEDFVCKHLYNKKQTKKEDQDILIKAIILLTKSRCSVVQFTFLGVYQTRSRQVHSGTVERAFRICALKYICERSTSKRFGDYSFYIYKIRIITEAERSQMYLRARLLNVLATIPIYTYLESDSII